jgi:glutamyl-tRNA reductase
VSWQGAIPRFAVAGVTWRDIDTAELARLGARVRDPSWIASAAGTVAAAELCPLATCNRVEMLLVAGPGERPAGCVQRLRAAFRDHGLEAPELRVRVGEAALAHLVEVAAGLDSAMPGEREIRGQLRAAVRLAVEAGVASAAIERLVHEALRIAARVHDETGIGGGRASLAELAVQRVLARVRGTKGGVLLVGVSPMTRRAAHRLARERVDLVVANRTVSRAAELARAHHGRAMPLAELAIDPPSVDAVICATASPTPVLDRRALDGLAAAGHGGRPPLLVDLAAPPDADPADALASGLELATLDDLMREAERTRACRHEQIADARRSVARHLGALRRERTERALSPVLRDLGASYRDTARRGVERLLEHDLRDVALQSSEREALLEWADALARRLAHLPTAGLRALSSRCGHDAVEAFLSAGDPRLLDALATSPAAQPDDLDGSPEPA